MNQERTLISDIEVQKFLNEHHNKTVIELTYLTGGKHSEAFSYTVDSKNYVARFNEKDRGFLKDRYAYEHFSKDIFLSHKYMISVNIKMVFTIAFQKKLSVKL